MLVYAGMDPRLPVGEVPAAARRAEALGFDGLQISETIHDSLAVSLLADCRRHIDTDDADCDGPEAPSPTTTVPVTTPGPLTPAGPAARRTGVRGG